ncbi:Uncharacterised protein [Mycobacteroides abscessus subsp. abscessus]|nr:Uncharacterised protein [Mycobacteroides abscessus subsp. abscessus]
MSSPLPLKPTTTKFVRTPSEADIVADTVGEVTSSLPTPRESDSRNESNGGDRS